MNEPRQVATKRPRGRVDSVASPEAELYTLGGVRLVRSSGEQATQLGPKHLALLTFLFHEQRPLHPSEVIELLGRGQADDKELAALKRAVRWLRDNVSGINIRIDSDTVEAIGGVRVDTKDVDAAIDKGDAGLVSVLYAGEFLEGFESGAPTFDEWAQKERGRLKRAWSHAMVSAAREAEQAEDWELAGEWWQILVERAPMRPDSVARLLRALARSGQEKLAAHAFAEYMGRLSKNGIAQPAEAVREVIAEEPLLQPFIDLQVDIAETAAVDEPDAAETPGDQEPDIASDPPVDDAAEVKELEVKGQPEGGAADGVAADDETSDAVAADIKEDLEQTGPTPTSTEDEPSEAEREPEEAGVSSASQPAGDDWEDEEWQDMVGFATADSSFADLSVDADAAANGRQSDEAESDLWYGEEEVAPEEGTIELGGPEAEDVPLDSELPPAAFANSLDPTLHGTDAEDALDDLAWLGPADGRGRAVRHEVTSVRKPWGPALKDSWEEIAPVRSQAAEGVSAGARRARDGAASVLGVATAVLGILGRVLMAPLRVLGWLAGLFRRRSRVQAAAAVAGPTATTRTKPLRPRRRGARGWFRRFWYAPVGLVLIALALAYGSRLGGVVEDITEELPAVSAPSLPRALPKVSVPSVAAESPSFVEISFSRIGAMLGGGAILGEPGQWILVADFDLALPPQPDLEEGLEETGPTAEDAGLAEASLLPADLELQSEAAESIPAPPGAITVADGVPAVRLPGETEDDLPIEPGQPTPNETDAPQAGLTRIPQATATAAEGERVVGDVPQDSQAIEAAMAAADSLTQMQDTLFAQDSIGAVQEGLQERPAVGGQEEEATLAALALALEADLKQARYFNVVPRERALIAHYGHGNAADRDLPVQAALTLAASQGYAAVISGQLHKGAEVDSLKLFVLNAEGDTLYGVAAEITDQINSVETLAGLSRAIRSRLGEAEEDIAVSPTPVQFLTSSTAALNAYARARRHLEANRYPQALAAGREATARDSTFSLAHLLMARTYALAGVRTRARQALEQAWRYSDRAVERESLRIEADRLAWDGRHSEAAVAYDELFQEYRDEAAALRSQAVMQRLIGVRGGGEGNLRVAYSLDPFDWPSLAETARYLGYSGPLPDIDSLVASLQPGE